MSTSIAAVGLGGLGRVLLRSLSDLDAAVIATPHALHHEQATTCLEAGLDALVEKPMVTDVNDAVELIGTADAYDGVLAIGYQRHFHPAFVAIKRIVDSGRIGDVHAANATLSQNWIDIQRGTWRTNPALSGGQLYDSGSHLIDALLWTTGATPQSVSAQMTFDAPSVDIDAALAIELDRDGRPVTASVSVSGAGVDGEPAEGYSIWGTDGRLTYDGERICVTEGGATTYETEITTDADFDTLTERKLEDFLAAVQGDSEPAVGGAIGLEITALTEAAYRAADEGRTADVRAAIEKARTSISTPSVAD